MTVITSGKEPVSNHQTSAVSSAALTAALEAEIGTAETVSTRLIDRVKYANDASHYLYTPQAVIQARSAADVAAVFRASRRTGVPVILRSGGSSLSGQGGGEGMLVDVRKHFRDIEVLDNGARVRVQPGATVRSVNNRLAFYGTKIGPDPASEFAATMGGVIANNSSGMACGTTFNTYRTLESMTFVLPSGTMINTADADASRQFREQEPDIFDTIVRLQRRVRENPESVAKIQRHFALKNTMGYGVNAFLDFDDPLDVFERLIIGSEGTLAFVAEAIFRTIPDPKLKTTTIAVFDSIEAATRTLPDLFDSEAATLELMDSCSIEAGRTFAKVPPQIQGFEVHDHAALLIEYHAQEDEELRARQARGAEILASQRLQTPAAFSTDPAFYSTAWAFRKGLLSQVSGARPSGTTALFEDVVVPVADLADTCLELQQMFDTYAYDNAVIFGHAKDGNIHFLITDRFEGEENLARYNGFNDDLASLIIGRHGNLKAEHGTGRVMAPFVRQQFGDELYEVMVALKRAVDPRGTMNPGVIISEDPEEHLHNMKLNPTVEEAVDRCVECGFCEPVCPSRDLTMTPRQRIVVRRARAKALADGNVDAARELDEAYVYEGEQTCAADSMCVSACPVGIDTGKFVKSLREQRNGRAAQAGWKAAAKQWDAVTANASRALTGAYYLPAGLVQKVTDVARGLASAELVPEYQKHLGKGGRRRSGLGPVVGDLYARPSAVFMPACVNAMVGPERQASDGIGATEAFVRLAERAGLALLVPDDVDALCCGTPWASKGMAEGHAVMGERVRASLLRATDGGRLPVVVDASSCAHGVADLAETAGIEVLDAVTYIAREALGELEVSEKLPSVTLHPTCSSAHMGTVGDLRAVAEAAADQVQIPVNWACCGYAGDRGMLHPELTESATRAEAKTVAELDSRYHAPSNRTCELGMTQATGEPYAHVLELLERATR
ncbi:FAD-binding oxidoreductase [Corynebacterium sp. NML 150383]|uniref:FAD-binding and (Fe-S)-binding domain-containing protein n=1 Tax=Corynebacterium sp. NML 150383 TaxID=2029400 RepID=UPI000BAA86BE|nr:FAD-binding and (Fe-S)-binding domain-containing protein [Corynebacterium sp. NML 150383]PAT02824.1 FAD-binding oxidoreductase [Corynebacterium sp. NML 150383]